MWILGFGQIVFFANTTPTQKLFSIFIVLLLCVKLAALFLQLHKCERRLSFFSVLIFLLAWTGVRIDGFVNRQNKVIGMRYVEAIVSLVVGCLTLVTAAYFGEGHSTLWNYVSLYGFLVFVLLGALELNFSVLWALGYTPERQFDRPLMATSLKDFWSHRWNMSFVDMNRLFLLEPLRKKTFKNFLVFLIFLISGLLHELSMSFPVSAGWGLPTLYFVIQGIGFLLEKKIKFQRIFVILWIVLPSPLLFHIPFTNEFLGTLNRWIFNAIFVEQMQLGMTL